VLIFLIRFSLSSLPCSAASSEVISEPHTGARPSVRLCVGLKTTLPRTRHTHRTLGQPQPYKPRRPRRMGPPTSRTPPQGSVPFDRFDNVTHTNASPEPTATQHFTSP
jgi:hypothetical protein